MKVRCDKGRKQVRISCGTQPDDTAEEKWLPVPSWEKFYCVSDLGRIWSMHQYGRFTIGMQVQDGYRVMKLRDNGRQAHACVHRIVLEAFVGPCPAGMEACHNNGIPDDNRLPNLRWDTAQSNQADKLKHGTARYSSGYILDKAVVVEIRIRTDITDQAWADALGVSLLTIRNARRGDTWKHVETPPLNRRH